MTASSNSYGGVSDRCMGRVLMIVVVLTSMLRRVHHVQHLGTACAQKAPDQDRREPRNNTFSTVV